MTQLEACLLAVRVGLDPELKRLRPVKLGKPYPLGQCLEIALAVEKRLRTVVETELPPEAAQGLRAFRAFLRAGGSFRQVWGDLRGEFFQNAFQLGTLYVDVSNDTVTPTKPKVEILPFAQARFVPIADFEHFARIAERYWKDRVYPNHVLPELAPYCPLVHISPQGVVQLRAPAMPAEVFDAVARALQGRKPRLAASAEAGRAQALRLCREYRAKRWHQSQDQTAKIIQAVQQANVRLAQWHASGGRASLSQPNTATLPNTPPMPTIQIDNVEYDLDSLSQDAKAQLQSIQFVDQELARLQAQTAALQTARNAYVSALKAALPVLGGGDTLKLS